MPANDRESLGTLVRPTVVLTLLLCVITGLVYPGVVTALARLIFPAQANGSLVTKDGQIVGSALIAQGFSAAGYFHPRPSAAGAGYDPTASAGTNKGPTDLKLADTLLADAVQRAMEEDGLERGKVPSDMATASGSGLDPHISPANAAAQVARVARERGLPVADVQALVARYTEGRLFGVLGEPRVNVLLLNLALDKTAQTARSQEH
jgi:potassium-transporting ATPase KdpC subunit